MTTGGSPSLEELWDGDKDLKWRTFLDVVHPSLWETKIRTLPPHMVVPVAILFYLQVGHLNCFLCENIWWAVVAVSRIRDYFFSTHCTT